MNSSFRTAFRALVLSLIIPLAAVVLAELAPNGLPTPTVASSNRTGPQPAAQTAQAAARQPAPIERTTNDQLAALANRAASPTERSQPAVTSRPSLASGNPPTRAVSQTNVSPSRSWSAADTLPDAEPPPLPSDPRRRAPKQRAVTLQPPEEEAADDAAPYQQFASHLTRMQRSLDQLSVSQQQSQQINQATQVLQQLQQQTQMAQLETRIKELTTQATPPDPSRTQPANATDGPALSVPTDSTKATKKPKKTEPKALLEEFFEESMDPEQPEESSDEPDMTSEDDSLPATKTPKETGPAVKPVITKSQPADDGSERFSLQLRDAEISTVLDMLGEFSGTNILASKEVTGKVSFNLHDVTIEEALDAILKVGGYSYTREGNFVYVTTTLIAEAKAKLNRKIVVKVYRPYYISTADFQVLLTPILTPVIGKISVTTPSETGVTTGGKSGGNSLSQRDAILVQDYAEVILEIDNILKEMDVPPTQVVIEATILSVKLDDSMKLGVNFSLLNQGGNQLVVGGNGASLNGASGIPGGAVTSIVPAAGEFIANAAGLKYGFLRGDASLFVQALETIADTRLVATPQLMVLNKQRAELIIGQRLSYKTLAFNGTQTAESVNFLDAGTKLQVRPFIAPDGNIRMELHPERSSGTINAVTGLPNLATTEVTTNVMVRDGVTVVIGGLIEETTAENFERIPFLGALPLVGPAFRNKTESVNRSELIVLITPRLVNLPDEEARGLGELVEGTEQADYFRDNTASFNRRNLARMQFELAQSYYDKGKYDRALHHIDDCLQHNKNDRSAWLLKKQIEDARKPRLRLGVNPAPQSSEPSAIPPSPDTYDNATDTATIIPTSAKTKPVAKTVVKAPAKIPVKSGTKVTPPERSHPKSRQVSARIAR